MASSSNAKTAAANLWSKVTDLRQLDQAWSKVRLNGGCSGGDGVSIEVYGPRSAKNLNILSRKLANGSYTPLPVRTIDIPKRSGGKRRLIIPSIDDRIVHTAIAQVLNPILDPMFEESSFAYRPGRSVKMAVQHIDRWRSEGYIHVIDADIEGYFDNIRHDGLIEKLEQALSEYQGAGELIGHVEFWLTHLSQQTGIIGKGVAQGSPMSPILANLYLDNLDERLHRRGVRIVRFADDFVVLCKSEATQDKALQLTKEVLNEEGLSLHSEKTRILDFDRGFEFLGHLFLRSMIIQKVSDPEEDPSLLLREIAETDETARKDALELEAALKKEKKGGYDRGTKVLYVTEPRRSLSIRNMSFVVLAGEEREIAAIANSRVDRIEVGPGCKISPEVYDLAIATQTELVHVDGYGSTQAWIEHPNADRGGLQLAQASAILDPETRLTYARAFVDARIHNQRIQLYRLIRESSDAKVKEALVQLSRNRKKLSECNEINEILGVEGASAAIYWPALGRCCKSVGNRFKRSRPAADPLNAAMNYLTAMLERDIRTALLAAGLHLGFGFLHSARDRHHAAVYDFMEPFRAPLTEGLPIYLFNSGRLKLDMFDVIDDDAVHMKRTAVKAIIKGYEYAVSRPIENPATGKRASWRVLMKHQAQMFGRSILGSVDDFTPYKMVR